MILLKFTDIPIQIPNSESLFKNFNERIFVPVFVYFDCYLQLYSGTMEQKSQSK